MNAFELNILNFIRENIANPFLDTIMPIITKFGDGGIFWIALAVVFLIFKKTRKMGLCMGLALLMGFITGNLLLKNIVARIRPYDLNPEVELLVKHLSDFSFPSGHTLASFEAATAIFINNKKWGIPALVLAFLIALSRIYLYVHYPTDVLAAIILGIGFAVLSCAIVKKYQDKICFLK